MEASHQGSSPHFSEIDMKHSHISKLLVPLALLIVSGLLVDSIHARQSPAQDAEKSLDIERYAKEPLELIELKIGEQPIKDRITIKSRRNGEGLDSVRFKESDDWLRRVRVRVRNISSKPIIGLRTYLYLKIPALEPLFRVHLTNPRQLQSEPLEQSAEIDLAVDEQSWKQTEGILNQYGADAKLAAVTLSVEIVAFGDGLQWNRGHFLRRDPNNPNSWIPISKLAQ